MPITELKSYRAQCDHCDESKTMDNLETPDFLISLLTAVGWKIKDGQVVCWACLHKMESKSGGT